MYSHVSESDLEAFVIGWHPDWPQENQEEFNDLLFSIGFDTELPVNCSIVQHKDSRGRIVNCRRWSGNERRDKEWLMSGNASWELRFHLSDPEIRKDLSEMQACDSIERVAKYYEWKQEKGE